MRARSTRGRPREEPPEGFLSSHEAAEILNLSPQAIRNRIRDDRYPPEDAKVANLDTGERRYYVRKSAVMDEANAYDALINYRDAAMAAKDETIAEQRQRAALLEGRLDWLETKVVAKLDTLERRLAWVQDQVAGSSAPIESKGASGEPEDKRSVGGGKGIYKVDGTKLRWLREELYLTQEELAKEASISPKRLSEIERRNDGIHASTLRDLAAALGVSPGELLIPRSSQRS